MRFLRIIIPIVAAAALIGTIGMFMYDRSKSVPPVITSVSGKNAAITGMVNGSFFIIVMSFSI